MSNYQKTETIRSFQETTSVKHHIVLLGDSIFDNREYVEPDPCVIDQLGNKLPSAWKATLRAIDGDKIGNVESQLVALPADSTFLILSVGGNDALGYLNLFGEKVRDVGEAILLLADVVQYFSEIYRGMLDNVLKKGLPIALCTIYLPRFPEKELQRVAVTALAVFNDVIIQEAFKHGLPLLDLRLICHDDADYANPIEPSAHGGDKITDYILKIVHEWQASERQTQVFCPVKQDDVEGQ
ncbi:MAG: SGNH/GDSL hydrolase family protein [SAR324 cluster bacterium]|nr:SGNH/GDSL hydrolase family protein [SAR324 cluster bacterium]